MQSNPDILLIYPPVMQKYQAVDPPFGLMYLAASLLKAEYSVEILDLNLLRPSETEIRKYFIEHKPSIVGIGGMTTVYYYIKWLADIIKSINPETIIIGGGSFITPCPETVLNRTKVDIACIGESEHTIVEVMDALTANRTINEIRGIAYKNADGKVIVTPARERIENIDELPFPAYDLVDMDYYIRNSGKRPSLLSLAEKKNVPIESISNTFILFSARGCPFSCTFCYRNFGRKVTNHSVDYIIKHLKYVREKFGVNNFAFYDETFNAKRKWVLEFCERIKKEMPDTYFWMGGARADLLDEELVRELKDASFYEISIGVESFDDRILAEMGKNLTADVLIRTINLLKKYDLAPSYMGMLYGFPKDDKQSLAISRRRLSELNIKAYFQFPIPFPGTILYEQLIRAGQIKNEEEFMLRLSDQMAQDLCINISRYPDKKLISMVRNAEFSLLLGEEYRRKGLKAMLKLYISKKTAFNILLKPIEKCRYLLSCTLKKIRSLIRKPQ